MEKTKYVIDAIKSHMEKAGWKMVSCGLDHYGIQWQGYLTATRELDWKWESIHFSIEIGGIDQICYLSAEQRPKRGFVCGFVTEWEKGVGNESLEDLPDEVYELFEFLKEEK